MKKTDVKENLDKQVELTADETEELVSVEMTAEQRDRIVRILADEKIKAKAIAEQGVFEMDLLWPHAVNGVKYGPGKKVQVPEAIHGLIQTQEQRQREQELGLNASQNRMFQVMASGQSVPVKVK